MKTESCDAAMKNPSVQKIRLSPTDPTPLRIEAAEDLVSCSNLFQIWNLRVENTLVPIIWPMFKKMVVNDETCKPKGDIFSTGAPDASW